MKMDITGMRRVSSAGYRLQPRTTVVQPKSSQPRMDRSLYAQEERASLGTSQKDAVKQDNFWREMVWRERRGVKEWEKNWDFLTKNDHLGESKQETPLPSYVSFFSDKVPCTSNQMFGSRLSSPVGKEVQRLDRLFLSSNNQRHKLGPEIRPTTGLI
ncbi:uncharacterized protein C2orf50 homolog [Boleophthalmus pectinirostris]|uniref:uncharacterized protein C2orf50 homolog n=1 Tax=Boleophthalmus pectinirostris TaxID=150288 RepID=UPI0024316620|nr:uncharacterized protein C2orf50 homolog [Boleophthalmus pectinirostris]